MSKTALKMHEYVKELVSLIGLIPGLISALPLANFLPNVSVFPPLGMPLEDYAITWTVVVGVLTTLAIFFLKDVRLFKFKSGRFSLLILCIVATVGLIVVHMHFRSEFVRTVIWSEKDGGVNVSIGKVLTPKAETAYPGLSDEAMLRKSGAAYEAVRKVYTEESLEAAHMWLYLSFVAPFLVAVAGGSFVVLFVALDKKTSEGTDP